MKEPDTMKDKLIAENQGVGDGQGFRCTRNLYERPDGTRYSVQVTPWEEIPSPKERRKTKLG
jgi:hypothetical protein